MGHSSRHFVVCCGFLKEKIVIEVKLCYHFSVVQHFPKFRNVVGVFHVIFCSLGYLYGG